ncbi:MAG: hypothetical protein K8L97_03020 [Anaerolineae bacterium]|nr:hypothetical protein [Anaerolineae bacterium]
MDLGMMRQRGIWLLVLPILLAACAIGDVPNQVTAPPQLTIPAAPTLNLAGNCNNTRELEMWLQITTQLVSDFQTTMNTAAAKTASNAYEDVLRLSKLRESAYQVAAPDCAADAQVQLTDTMSKAVDAFQAYVNGQSTSVATIITELNGQFDQVITVQDDLLARMNAQIQTQIAPTTSP